MQIPKPAPDQGLTAEYKKRMSPVFESGLIAFTGFGGMIPKLDNRALPPGFAAKAVNCKLTSSSLDSFFAPLTQATLTGTPVDFYEFDTSDGVTHRAGFAYPTDVVRAPILNDAFDRLYFTDTTGSYITTRGNLAAGNVPAVPLGIPSPSTPSFAVVPTGGTSITAEVRVYLCTLVSQYGEEGSPGTPVTVTGNSDGTWTLNGLNSLAANAQYTTLEYLRVYRTVTTSNGVNYFEVAQFALNALPASYVDGMSSPDAASQPILPSLTWGQPPLQMIGLISSPAGFLAGFKGRTVYFSEPYYPHAWPQQYQLAVEDDIVGLGVFGSSIVVCTKGRPYLLLGTTPGLLSLQKINEAVPCLSKRGIVSMGGAVYFPTYDGIMQVSDSGFTLYTQALLTKDEWAAYSPSTIQADAFEGRYYAFYDNANGFIFDPNNPKTGWVQLLLPNVKTVRQSYVTGRLQILVGTNVQLWDGDLTTRIPYEWISGEQLTVKPVNLGACQVRASFDNTTSPEPVHMELYGDSVLRWSYDIDSPLAVVMPSGYKASSYSILLSGEQRVFNVNLAGTGAMLQRVV